MSIVDKTLQRLGSPEGTPASMPLGTRPALPDDLLYVAGARKPKAPVSLWLGGIFLAGGAAAYFLLPDHAAVPPAPTSSPVVAQPAPVVPVAVAEPAPVLVAAPAHEANPTLVVPPAVAEPVMVLAAAPTPEAKPAVVVPVPEAKPAVIAPLAEAKPAPVALAPEAKPAPAASPDWLSEGWVRMSAANAEQALSVWEEGLRALPDHQPLIVGYAYLDRHGMNTALSRRDPDWAAFAIREGRFPRGGEPRYRLIVLAPSDDPAGLNSDVSAQFGRADRISAGYMKRRLLAASAAVAPEPSAKPKIAPAAPPTVKDPPKEAPKVVQKEAPKLEAPKAAPVVASPKPMAVSPTPPQPLSEDRRDWSGRSDAIREQLRQGAYGPAEDGAEKLSRDFPDRWEPLHWLGTAQLARGRLDEAENALERATALNPNTPHVWIQRAVAAQERQDHAAAVNYLREAEKLAPRMPEIFLNKGFSHDALGQSNDAEKSFSRFLTLTDGVAAYATQRKHIQNRLQR